MGFTTKFFSGLTLTSTTLYLSLLYHQSARAHQSALLHQQATLLDSLTDPAVASDLATIADANYSGGFREGIKDYRIEKAHWTETFKVVWNKDVTDTVRSMQGIRWGKVRDWLDVRAREWKEGERRL